MSFPLNVIVASAVRTPVGRALKGSLRYTRPDDLAGTIVKAAVEKSGVPAEAFEDLILGCAFPEGEQGLNVGRNAVFLAGLPDSVPGQTVNRYCSSGLQAIAMGAMAIQCGLQEAVIAGGVESMSMVPMSGNKVRLNPKLVDNRPEAYIGMGYTAERVAQRFGVSREDQDNFAVSSHEKAIAAIEAGRFKDEIVPVMARNYKNGQLVETPFEVDECPRPGTTAEVLGKLRPVFAKNGSVTAGNASPMNDGAAATVLLSEATAEKYGAKAIARFRGYAVKGVPPDIMGIGPVPAIQALLAQTGLSVDDIDCFEINEAFAAQAVYCARELKIPAEKLNVNGGAIALGHPLGATGAKLSATVIHEVKRRGGKYGVVSMCIGGGMGAAGLYEIV